MVGRVSGNNNKNLGPRDCYYSNENDSNQSILLFDHNMLK